MQKPFLIKLITSLTFLCLFLFPLFGEEKTEDSKNAKNKSEESSESTTPKKKPSKKARFKLADNNQDGKITKEDFSGKAQKKFASIDLNSDGEIDYEEKESYMMMMKEKKSEAMQKKLDKMLSDKNNDGKITKTDLPEKMQKQFAKIDKNKDGKIDGKEKKDHMWAAKDKLLNGPVSKDSSGKKKKKKKPKTE